MSEWKEYKLGDAAELITGFPFKGDKYEMNGNLKVVRGENVTLGILRDDAVECLPYDSSVGGSRELSAERIAFNSEPFCCEYQVSR